MQNRINIFHNVHRNLLPVLGMIVPAVLSLVSCSISVPDVPEVYPTEVGFSVNGPVTKVFVEEEGISSTWELGDKVSLWARNSGGSYTLANQQFKVLAKGDSKAVFTATLASPMAEGTYRYTACYPVPASVDNTVATFNIPSVQDGSAGNGANIMISDVVDGGALKSYKEGDGLSLSMNHLVHLMKFYLPKGSNGLNGENVRKIEFTFPTGIAGDISVDISEPSAIKSFANQTNTVTLEKLNLAPSGGEKVYASAAIFPADNVSGQMNITLYSDSYCSVLPSINVSRDFLAGHCTPVSLNVGTVSQIYSIDYIVASNNLGENIQKITFSAPSGCKFGDDGGNTFVYEPGQDIPIGFSGLFSYKNKDNFLMMSEKTVTVTYDSEHAVSVQTITLPDLSSITGTSMYLEVPYLLSEDFSSVPSFSSNDKYSMSSLGSKDPYAFLDGWSGGRVGGSAGESIRIAARRECGLFVDEHYNARVESAPMSQLKKSTDIVIDFDYGCGRDYTSSPASGDTGQKVWVGYITTTTQYSSGDTDGTYPENFTTDDKDGSWTKLPSHFSAEMTLPAGSTNRISWRSESKDLKNFGSNTTNWFYIDNVKVRIKSE